MNVLDLFSGIGGFSLGLERAGMRTVAFCEIDPQCRRVIDKHWPFVARYHDVQVLNADRLETDGITVDLICGGFPCQPFSTASRGRRTASDLWPEMLRIIRSYGSNRPQYVIAENVQEEAIAKAAGDLEGLGYATYYRRISGIDCGADHIRNRWWAFAYPHAQSELRGLIDAEVAKLPALCAGLWGPENYKKAIRVSDGLSDRMDGPGLIGNAVIPQIPEIIGRAILAATEAMNEAAE